MIRRIGIMGAGAIGSVVGGMLTKAGLDVTFIDQWPPHIEAQKFVDAAAGRNVQLLEDEMAAGARGMAGGRPSLLQDVMRGRRTEIEELNGYVVDEGERLGVATPFNEAIVREVLRHGVGTLQPDPRNLAPLAAMLPRR